MDANVPQPIKSHDREAEPAEPREWITDADADPDADEVTNEDRRQTRLIDVKGRGRAVTDLPKPLIECGCGDCPDTADPLRPSEDEFGTTIIDPSMWAAEVCPEPRPVTVGRAGEITYRYARARLKRDGETSKPEQARTRYATVMEHDRYARREYGDALTTVLLSCRVRPIVSEGIERRWAPPLALADKLFSQHDSVLRRVRGACRRHTERYKYAWVVAGTERYASPHYHVYAWCDDPDDNLRPSDFCGAINANIEAAQAYREDHPVAPDGDDGAVTIRHNPSVADVEDGTTIEREDGTMLDLTAAIRAGLKSEVPYREATRAALYVASQFPYLSLLDADPEPPDRQAAAIKWAHNAATNRRWFNASTLPRE
jgi:hypothetical protein